MSPNSTSAGGSTLASEGPGLGPAGPATPASRAVRRDRRRGRSGRRRSGGADDEIRLVRVFSPVGKPIGVLAYLVKSMQSTYGTIGTTCNDLKLSYPTFFPAPGGPGAARRTPRTSTSSSVAQWMAFLNYCHRPECQRRSSPTLQAESN